MSLVRTLDNKQLDNILAEDEEDESDGKDPDYIAGEEQYEEPNEEYILHEENKEEEDKEEASNLELTTIEEAKPAKLKSWQSSYLTVKHPEDTGKEGCKACVQAFTAELETALSGTPLEDAAVQAIKKSCKGTGPHKAPVERAKIFSVSTVCWRNFRTRLAHLAKCPRQPEEVRQKAKLRVAATDTIQQNSDNKRTKRKQEALSTDMITKSSKKKRTESVKQKH